MWAGRRFFAEQRPVNPRLVLVVFLDTRLVDTRNLRDAKAPAGKYFENLPDRTTSNYTPKYEYLNSLNRYLWMQHD